MKVVVLIIYTGHVGASSIHDNFQYVWTLVPLTFQQCTVAYDLEKTCHNTILKYAWRVEDFQGVVEA